MLIFDIETGPLPGEQLKKIWVEPDPPPHPGEFDPSTVKFGNLKDPAKKQLKIREAQERHQQEVKGYAYTCDIAKQEAWDEFVSKAALDAATGRVLAIGYYNPDKDSAVADYGEEYVVLQNFWIKATQCREDHRSMVGLNIYDFDLPFLMRRSWINEIDVPPWVIKQDRFFDSVFVDLRRKWLCGQYGGACKSSFDHLAKAFGTEGKPEGVDGSQFAELFEKDRHAAIAYLLNDVKQPAAWCRLMGVR